MRHTTESIKAAAFVLALALSGVWTIGTHAETVTTGLEPEPETITRTELADPPAPQYKGDYTALNIHGEFGRCMAETIGAIPNDVTALERKLLMEQAQRSCNDGIEAWHAVESEKAKARAAEAGRTPFWQKVLLTFGNTALQVGANILITDINTKASVRQTEARWGTLPDLIGGSGDFNIEGGQGDISINQRSPGSFNAGDVAQDSPGAYSEGSAMDSDGAFGTESQFAGQGADSFTEDSESNTTFD